MTLNDREWICTECGSVHDRDLNVVNNIKTEGYKIKIGLSSPESTLQESKPLGPRRMKKQTEQSYHFM